jgi:hypothetical protein
MLASVNPHGSGGATPQNATMFSKATFALAFALATASGALAATKQQSFQPPHDVYDARGTVCRNRSGHQRLLRAAAGLGY